MNKHYEHIRKVCIAKNPSILDLVMGCEVIIARVTYTVICAHGWGQYTIAWKEWYWVSTVRREKEEFELILGRQITLQDVLLALKSYSPNVHLMLRDDEEWLSIAMMWSDWIKYDLTKPLSEQSDEVLEWIAKQIS